MDMDKFLEELEKRGVGKMMEEGECEDSDDSEISDGDDCLSREPKIPNLGNPELQAKLEQYLSWDKNATTRNMIRCQAMQMDVKGLEKSLLNRLEFGTAGLRGRMGPGYNSMNDLVVIQTTQGLVRYLEKTDLNNLKARGVVIAFDGRYNSRRFGFLAAAAFVWQGYPIRVFRKMCPTPFVPFAISYYKCAAGIMVTASHNPKEDNGYKVFWNNGAQIIAPHDKGIQGCILENLEPWKNAWITTGWDKSLCFDPTTELTNIYLQQVVDSSPHRERNASSTLNFTYTAMHGVGYDYMQEAFLRAKLKPLIPVAEQIMSNPEFPTVRFPNPEEGKSALNLAIKTANANNSTIILANDPDADRLAVAEKLKNGEWKIFNGNELGALLGWWALFSYIESHGRDGLKDCYMIASTVSSKILKSMAAKEGFNFIETLTGFKWMGNIAFDLIKNKKTVLFAFEEAIGFMCGTDVLDKDGISAGVRMGELATYLSNKGSSLNEKLQDIYNEYGFHVSCNSYYLCYEPKTVVKIFDEIRSMGPLVEEVAYPTGLMDEKCRVIRIRDLTTGFDSGEPDKKATLPISKSSQMITFTFDNGLVVTLRTSGTEPKVKFYTEFIASPDQKDWVAVRKNLNEMVSAMLKEWVHPEKWGLQRPPDEEGEKAN